MSAEFGVDRIPFRRENSVSTEFHGHPSVHLVEKNFNKCFYYTVNICFFLVFKNVLAD